MWRSEHIVHSRIKHKSNDFNPPSGCQGTIQDITHINWPAISATLLNKIKKANFLFFLFFSLEPHLGKHPNGSCKVWSGQSLGAIRNGSLLQYSWAALPLFMFLSHSLSHFCEAFLRRNCSTKAGEVLIKGANQWVICTRHPQSLTIRDEQKFFVYLYMNADKIYIF